MLALGGAALAGLAFAGVKLAEAQSAPAYTDADILNFALNLEYLEAQFYTLATSGKTIDTCGHWHRRRHCNNLAAAQWSPNPAAQALVSFPGHCLRFRRMPRKRLQEERNHVNFLRAQSGYRGRRAAQSRSLQQLQHPGRRGGHCQHLRSFRQRSRFPDRRIHLRGRGRYRIQWSRAADHHAGLPGGGSGHSGQSRPIMPGWSAPPSSSPTQTGKLDCRVIPSRSPPPA